MTNELQKAMTAYNAGKLESAAKFFAKHLKRNPKDSSVLYIYGVLSLQLGAIPRGVTYLKKAHSIDPDNPKIMYSLARAYGTSDAPEQAIALYRASLEAGLLQPDTYLELANELDKEDHATEAEKAASDGLAAFPGNPALLDTLARIRVGQSDYKGAQSLLGEAVKTAIDEPVYKYNLANVLKSQGKLDEAITFYKAAINQDAEFYQARVNLGNALIELGQYDAGFTIFDDSHNRRHAVPTTDTLPVTNDTNLTRTTGFKLRHDIDQLRLLAARGIQPERFSTLADNYQELYRKISPRTYDKPVPLTENFLKRHKKEYNRALYVADGIVPPSGSINTNLDIKGLQDNYFDAAPNYVAVDDLLSEAAWQSLYNYCLESTIWYDFSHHGYLGAYLQDGFSAPVLLDLALSLPKKFPRIFGDHKLVKIWGYKYDPSLSVTGLHADFAAVNVNLWLTPTEAATDPYGSGLTLYSVEAPHDWSFEDYNGPTETIKEYVASQHHEKINIPFRKNRALIFNSQLFHASGAAPFKDSYEERRINITLLYGQPPSAKSP